MIIQPSEGINKANYYGSCATAAATAAKTVTIDGFVLEPGARVSVYFSNMNTAASPTLNVSGTGAYTIWFEYSDFYNYNALHELCEFVFVDGGTSSYWMYVGHPSSTLRNDAIGYTEYGSVARSAHSTGSYITWKDKFYKVSADIAAGDTLAVGTNLTETKVGDAITSSSATVTFNASLPLSTITRNFIYKYGNVVTVGGSFRLSSSVSAGTIIFTIPEHYRTNYGVNLDTTLHTDGNPAVAQRLSVSSGGNAICPNVALYAQANWQYCFTYVIKP